jgi:hypothetical protein
MRCAGTRAWIVAGRVTWIGSDEGLVPVSPRMNQRTLIRAVLRWSRRADLNRRPAVYETAALPLSYVGISDTVRKSAVRSVLNGVVEGQWSYPKGFVPNLTVQL